MQFIIRLGKDAVLCELVPPGTPEAWELELADPEDLVEVQRAITDDLQLRYWCWQPEFMGLKLTERAVISLGNETSVDVFSFLPRRMNGLELAEIGTGLSCVHDALRTPDQWRVKSIQIMAADSMNSKNGEPMRGQEYIREGRFLLFPASFAAGSYRDRLSCTWLKGAVIHEATHVCLEDTMLPLWNKAASELGWVNLPPNTLVRLPGGGTYHQINLAPERCPTPYATMQTDDDRAESVVAYFTDREKLDPVRRRLIEQVLTPSRTYSHGIGLSSANLDKRRAVKYALKKREGLFGPVTIHGTGNRQPHQVLELQEVLERFGRESK